MNKKQVLATLALSTIALARFRPLPRQIGSYTIAVYKHNWKPVSGPSRGRLVAIRLDPNEQRNLRPVSGPSRGRQVSILELFVKIENSLKVSGPSRGRQVSILQQFSRYTNRQRVSGPSRGRQVAILKHNSKSKKSFEKQFPAPREVDRYLYLP